MIFRYLLNYRKKTVLFIELSKFTAFLLILKIPNQLTIPIFSLLLLFALFFFYSFVCYRKNTSLKFVTSDKGELLLTVIFGFYLLLSLSWTGNYNYGAIKAINLFLICFPLTVIFLYLLMHNYNDVIKYFGTIIVLLSAGLTLLVVASGPFNFENTKNTFGFSHVGFGRMVSLGVVIVLFKILSLDKYKITVYLITVLLLLGLLVSGLRGAVLSSILTSVIIIVKAVQHKKMRIVHSLIILTSLAASFSIFLLLKDHSDPILQRYYNLITLKATTDGIDASINSRMKGLLIASDMFIDKPVVGVGLGGYKQNYNGKDVAFAIEYPHNILVEVGVELGIIGLLIFFLLVFKAWRKLLYFDFRLFAIWLICLLLAFFSGNIADQKIFLILTGAAIFLPGSARENKLGVI